MNKKITIQNVKNFRKLEDPNERNEKAKYVCYVNVHDIPHDIPMETNPRDQKLTTNIAKGIKESLRSNDMNFHLKNRGMVMSAKSADFNNKTNELVLTFDDEESHGNIDGGHTYKIIQENIYNSKFDGKDSGNKIVNSKQYVFWEIMVDVEDMIEDLAEARNRSAQVDDKSLAELQKHFEPIKDAIGGMSFYDRIAFKQNQQIGPGIKMIDAREIIAIISMFDIDKYQNNHPKQAYSSKKVMLDKYLINPEHFEKFSNIADDIFDLYDEVEIDFASAYNETGGKYGNFNFAASNNDKIIKYSKFSETGMKYAVPDGIIYPIVAAFRALVQFDEQTEKFKWIKDPIQFYKSNRCIIAEKTMGVVKSLRGNPNAAGKESSLWDILYMTVILNSK
ncbi:AIPR family protein [Staphylococcus caprae]|uniref:AIPR family protein n=2 Tax=Staphylococcus caprae TaxID=29380 RepID=UPI000E682505|nr:AIPR family protein [Staphylococcus caprae]MDK6296801.1 AIPR family protein [Staphylococcus caprae]MDK7232412.1 AIPR family protein [Staphylococcus caprae]RIM32825.1 abortive phage infection protein [Staphylococcus caprae]